MKTGKLILTAALIVASASSFAQSNSFEVLRENFSGTENVHCFRVSGFFCRTILWMAGENEVREAFRDVTTVRLITIPKQNFKLKSLSVPGFRGYLKKDNFESLATLRENGERVEVYLQGTGNLRNRYIVLVEEADEVTVIEVKGYIDIQKLREIEKNNTLSYKRQ